MEGRTTRGRVDRTVAVRHGDGAGSQREAPFAVVPVADRSEQDVLFPGRALAADETATPVPKLDVKRENRVSHLSDAGGEDFNAPRRQRPMRAESFHHGPIASLPGCRRR
jgi:hypothetical protein